MTSVNNALDEVMGHCAKLSDRLAADGYIDDSTYAALTRVVCDMGRSWSENDIEAFRIFHSLFMSHYNLILWLFVLPEIKKVKRLNMTPQVKKSFG